MRKEKLLTHVHTKIDTILMRQVTITWLSNTWNHFSKRAWCLMKRALVSF